jgi:hypothetical protein
MDIIIGLTRRIEIKEQLDEIIMTTKWKIHANKQLGETTCFYQILFNIKNMLHVQKLIANRNLAIQKYDIKWGSIEDYIT